MRSLSKSFNLKVLTDAVGLTKQAPIRPRLLDKALTWQPPEDVNRSRGAAIQLPIYPIRLTDVQDMSKNCWIFRHCIMKIGQECFRRGAEWKPANPDSNPPKEEYQRANEFFRKVALLDKCQRMEDDLNAFDIGFLVIKYDYLLDLEGNIIGRIPIGLVRGSPIFMRQVSDEKGNLGGKYRICLVHRHIEHSETEFKCRKCGRKTHDVHFITLRNWAGEEPGEYYIQGEVLKRTKFERNLIYGQSLIATNWRMGYTLMYMQKYGQDRFELGQQINTVFAYPTDSLDELEKMRIEVEQRKKQNQHYVPWMAYPQEAKNKPEFVSVNQEFEENQFVPLMDKYEQIISAQYGVSPIMMGDTSTSGGLNNEGNQFVVTNRAVVFAQKTYNGDEDNTALGIFDELTAMFEIRGWVYRLKSPEEEDEMAEKQRFAQDLANAANFKALGGVVKYQNKKFIYEEMQTQQAPITPKGFSPNNQAGSANASPQMPEHVGAAEQTSGHPGMHVQKKKSVDIPEPQSLDIAMEKEFWGEAAKAIVEGALWNKFEGLSDWQTESVHKILADSFMKGGADLTVAVLTDKLMNMGLDYAKAELIGRTEMTAVANKAREIGFTRRDPESQFKYKWSVHYDHRTSPTCKLIDQMVKAEGGAVSMKRMLEIQRAAVKETMPASWEYRDWTPHPNCRSTLQRDLGSGNGP